MGQLDLQVHKFEKVPGSTQTRLVGVKPYLRICRQGHPPLFVQGGQVYGEGGALAGPLPEWFPEEMAKTSEKVRAEVGWRDPEPVAPEPKAKPGRLDAVNPAKAVTMWTCPQDGCGETMPTNKKGIHIAAHARKARQPVVAGHV